MCLLARWTDGSTAGAEADDTLLEGCFLTRNALLVAHTPPLLALLPCTQTVVHSLPSIPFFLP
jgi:hypothetical protein